MRGTTDNRDTTANRDTKDKRLSIIFVNDVRSCFRPKHLVNKYIYIYRECQRFKHSSDCPSKKIQNIWVNHNQQEGFH